MRKISQLQKFVGTRIQDVRASLAVSQAQFCDLFNRRFDSAEAEAENGCRYNLNQPSLSRYETGAVTPPADMYEALLSMDYTSND